LTGSGRVTAETIAWEIRALCEDLLTGHYDATQACRRLGMDSAVLAAPLQDLITKVNKLTDQAPQEVWDFDVVSGARLDSGRQPAPLGTVRSTPSRQVRSRTGVPRQPLRTYALQLVFTAPKFRLRR
jgi:hypothetical protein